MKVYGKCKNCQSEIGYRTGAGTRVEFAMYDGDSKTLKCENCGTETEFHVDELYAKESKIAQIIALIVFLVGTPTVFFLVNPIIENNNYMVYIFGGYLLLPVIVYALVRKQDQARVNSFNRRKLRGRVHNIGK